MSKSIEHIEKCESCEKVFTSEVSLLRHVSHKKICKDHYGSDWIEKKRNEGRLQAKRKWKETQAPKELIDYERNKCDMINYADAKRRRESAKGKHYSYVSEEVRQKTDGGKAFYKFFKLIYNLKREGSLKDLENFVHEKYFNKCVDFALDKVFNEEKPYVSNYHCYIQDFEEEEKLINQEWEKSLETSFDNYLKDKISKEVKSWKNFASHEFSLKCDKQLENFAFCNFFGDFEAEIFPPFFEDAMEMRKSISFLD